MKKTNRDIFTVMELSGAGVKGSSLELFTAARTITGKTGNMIVTYNRSSNSYLVDCTA